MLAEPDTDFMRGRPIDGAVDFLLGSSPLAVGRYGRWQLVRLRGRRMASKASVVGGGAGSPPPSSARLPSIFMMRTVTKAQAVRLRLARHLRDEREILLSIAPHPFVLGLHGTGQDKRNIYMLQEFAHGGELFAHLRHAGRFEPDRAKFYASQVAQALQFLHERCGAGPIVHRDVRPESILLDRLGYVRLAAFGFAKWLSADHDRTWTLCGTPEYLAPEMLTEVGHGVGVDWWAFGVIVFEMLAGFPPFYAETPALTCKKVLEGRMTLPRHFDQPSRELVKALLHPEPARRLGCLPRRAGRDGRYSPANGAGVLAHEWFKGCDHGALPSRQAEAPFVPVVGSDEDGGNYESCHLHDLDDDEDEELQGEGEGGGDESGGAGGGGPPDSAPGSMRAGRMASADEEEAALLADF